MNDTGVEITAGLGGFLVVFFLAIVLILLGMDLSKRLRRLKHQEQLRLEQEAAGAAPQGSGESDEIAPEDGNPGQDESQK